MKPSINQEVGLRFGGALLILALIGVVSYRSMHLLTESTAAVARTHQALGMLERVLGDITEAESGQRGFLLTTDEQYLATYRAAIDSIDREVAALHALLAGSPQQQRLTTLAALLRARADLLRQGIEIRRAEGLEASLAFLRTDRGRLSMDRIRQLVGEMEAAEERLLAEQMARERDSFRAAAAITALGLLLSFALLLLAWLAMRRELLRRRLAEEVATRAKEAAEAADRAKSDFLARMSHELRTPLNSVIGFANLLHKNRDGNLRPQELSYLERISANGRHLLTLINDVLDLSKIEAGRLSVKLAPVQIDAVIRDVLAQFEVQARDRELRLAADLPERVVPLVCDADKLKQVLINLVGNALKFTARGGITVALQVDPQSRRPRSIQVADTGIGIPPERQEAIFEAFTQADSGTARTYGGTGLGLTISRSLCQRMGWELTVASQVGQGSTFTILLSGEPGRPAQPSAATPAVPASSHSDPGRRLVLAIDDDPDACLLLSRYAEEAGCQVITASSGPQGLRLARERRPALILLDLLMPHTNGWEVLHLLKADPALRDIPIVVISVVGNESRGTVLEAVEVIDKPFTRADLLCVLQRNLGDQPVSSAP